MQVTHHFCWLVLSPFSTDKSMLVDFSVNENPTQKQQFQYTLLPWMY